MKIELDIGEMEHLFDLFSPDFRLGMEGKYMFCDDVNQVHRTAEPADFMMLYPYFQKAIEKAKAENLP